jgi:CheY-like chemotaxis protein
MLGTVLTENDYRVLQAEDGARALELFIHHSSEVSAVIIDMVMPVLDGQKAMRAMLQIRPDTKFLAITGLMQPGDLAQEAHASQIRVLRKPFTSPKVLEALTAMIQ